MGRPGWATPAQFEWLNEQAALYSKIKGTNKTRGFWDPFHDGWKERWPVPDIDDFVPSSERAIPDTAANTSSNAPAASNDAPAASNDAPATAASNGAPATAAGNNAVNTSSNTPDTSTPPSGNKESAKVKGEPMTYKTV